MTLDPSRPKKKRWGFWGGGRSPTQVLRGPGPRRDMGWFWDWVLGLGNVSRILENVADSDFQYFQDRTNSFKIVVHIIAILGLNYQKSWSK